MTVSVPGANGAVRRASKRCVPFIAMAVALPLLGFAPPASADVAVGDQPIAWVEVEDGQISGGPALNSGDHGNFSGTGSYTFRETGMMSTMTVKDVPEAGTYPIHVRYAAGWLSAEEDVTRSMGLLTNGGSRQQMSLPITSSLADEAEEGHWESWNFWSGSVTLKKGTNTVAVQCDRSVDFCRLNFDAIQIGGTTPDPCVASQPEPRFRPLFDGTFASFDRWRKAGSGGFGMQAVGSLGGTPCYLRGLRGRGATWLRDQQDAPYTLKLDWNRPATDRASNVYLGSSSRNGVDPVGGLRIPIGADTGAIIPTGGAAVPGNAAAVASALRPVGSWNTYTIQVTGAQVRLLLNDTLVNTADVAVAAGGFIGIENSAAGAVDFKDIRIADLVSSTTTVQVVPAAVSANGSRAKVVAQVSAAGGTPIGDVEFSVDGSPVGTARLVDGAASAKVGPFPRTGTRSVTVRYLGSDSVTASSGSARIVVRKASAKLSTTVKPRKIVAKKTRATVRIRVRAPGMTPTGKVKVKVGKKTVSGTLRKGQVTIKLAKIAKPGRVKVTVTYGGNAFVKPVATTLKIKVNRR